MLAMLATTDDARELIIPNIHAAFLHLPIGLLIVGTLIEVFSFFWRGSGFRAAGRWMILLGALLSIPTATAGMYALWDVGNADRSFTVEQRHMIQDHIVNNSVAALLACLVAVTWIGSSNNWRRKLHWPLLIVLLVAVGFMVSGAWHGGEMVYAQGIAVGHKEAARPISDMAVALKKSFHPLELHVIAAGFLVSLALGALALSIRAISVAKVPETTVDAAPADAAVTPGDVGEASLADVRAALAEDAEERVPSTRFWLLSALVGLGVAAGGLYAAFADPKLPGFLPFNWHEIKEELQESKRIAAHAIVGVSIVVLTLVLAMLSRWGKRSKVMLSIFAFLLVLAVAAQIWIGTLLLYDGDTGSLTKFEMSNPPATQPATRAADGR